MYSHLISSIGENVGLMIVSEVGGRVAALWD